MVARVGWGVGGRRGEGGRGGIELMPGRSDGRSDEVEGCFLFRLN